MDSQKLEDLLAKWKTAEQSVGDGVSFGEAMRLLSGVGSDSGVLADDRDLSFTRMIPGKGIIAILNKIKSSETSRQMHQILKSHLHTELRPYQKQGVAWLYQLNQMQLGGILADDMGLGKTIQVLALLLLNRNLSKKGMQSLLIVPASLIDHWKSELSRFAPSLTLWIAHPSGEGYGRSPSYSYDLTITTYGSVAKITWASDYIWNMVIVEEAQSIKNPGAKQTKAVKKIQAQHRLALTGTPVENRLSDLWSLFDFVSPGLLGSAKQFGSFMKNKMGEGLV